MNKLKLKLSEILLSIAVLIGIFIIFKGHQFYLKGILLSVALALETFSLGLAVVLACKSYQFTKQKNIEDANEKFCINITKKLNRLNGKKSVKNTEE